MNRSFIFQFGFFYKFQLMFNVSSSYIVNKFYYIGLRQFFLIVIFFVYLVDEVHFSIISLC